MVLNFEKDLSSALNLKEIYNTFENTLPKRGCYNSGGMINLCYITNSIELGYSGATKLPLGFYIAHSSSYIGKIMVNASASLQYNFDNNDYHHLNLQTAKWNLFYKKSTVSDFIIYNYQNRRIIMDDVKNKFENHQIKYGFNLKNNMGFGVGLDFLSRDYKKVGAHFYASKWFSKPNLSTVLSASIFDNQINYKAELFKSFNFNNQLPIKRISLGLVYEDFMNYKDLYFSIRVGI